MLIASATHVLIIVWADVGTTDVAPFVPTVEFTQFAARGVELEAWITQPIGSHTMYSALFGEYPLRNGNTRGFSWYADAPTSPDIRLEVISLPEAAKAAGYSVALHGKWGLGGNSLGPGEGFRNATPFAHGFTTWEAGIGENVEGGTGRGYIDWERLDAGVQTRSRRWADDAIKSAWVDWWTTTRGPRFSVVWFAGAHGPFAKGPPSRLLPPGYIAFNSPRGRYESIIVAADGLTGEMLSHVDFDDTLVFLFTTCGTPDSAQISPIPTRVKRSTFDTGIRTPAAVRGPGIGPGKSKALVSPVDLWATLSDLTPIGAPPRSSDSVSFAHVLEDPSRASRRSYVYSHHAERAVRTSSHKLRDDGAGNLELYDLAADPGELAPLDPSTYSDQELVRRLRHWLFDPGSGAVIDRGPAAKRGLSRAR